MHTPPFPCRAYQWPESDRPSHRYRNRYILFHPHRQWCEYLHEISVPQCSGSPSDNSQRKPNILHMFLYQYKAFSFFHSHPPPAGESIATSSPSLNRYPRPTDFPFTKTTKSFASRFVIPGTAPFSSSTVRTSASNPLTPVFNRLRQIILL